MKAQQGIMIGAVAAILILPWVAIQLSMSINGDVAWLTQAAQRFLAGESMSQSYFDTNPPMSILVYVPAALLAAAGFSLWQAPFVYMLVMLVVALALDVVIMRRWAEMSPPKVAGIVGAHMVFVTLAAQHEFGQKDHMIAVMIMPLLLAQFSIVRGYGLRRGWHVAAVLLAVPFILLKPHYGLLPVMMMAARGWHTRSWRAVIGLDFWALAVGVVLYAAAVVLWFPDFVDIILPLSLASYVGQYEAATAAAAGGAALLAACLCVMAYFMEGGERRAQALFFSMMALAATVPVFVQMKGFSAHMLPCLALLGPAAFVVLAGYKQNWFETQRRVRTVLVLVVLAGAGYTIWSPNRHFPTHTDYRDHPVSQMIVGDGGAFFMQSNTTNIVAPLSVYTGARHASRFPGQWFMPLTAGDAEFWAEMTAADWAQFRPELVFLLSDPPEGWDMAAVFNANPAFAAQWALYRRTGTITIDPAFFYAGTRFAGKPPLQYDVYRRDGRI